MTAFLNEIVVKNVRRIDTGDLMCVEADVFIGGDAESYNYCEWLIPTDDGEEIYNDDLQGSNYWCWQRSFRPLTETIDLDRAQEIECEILARVRTEIAPQLNHESRQNQGLIGPCIRRQLLWLFTSN